MKRKWLAKFSLVATAAIALFGAFGFSGCDGLGAKGQKFEVDDIVKVLEAVTTHNYSVCYTDSESCTYVTEQVIVYDIPSVTTTYFATTMLRGEEGSDRFVGEYSIIRTSSGRGGCMSTGYKVNSIEELYDKQGFANVILKDWEYNEAEKNYTCGTSTLRIKGRSVFVDYVIETTVEGDDGKRSVEFFALGETTVEIPDIVLRELVENDGYIAE